MTTRTKKTIYLTSIILGIVVFTVSIVRTTYTAGFQAVQQQAVHTLGTVSPFGPSTADASEIDDTKPAISSALNIFPRVEKTTFNITIPSIDVDASIEEVGIKKTTGNIDTPKKLSNAAWYTGSVTPGEKGTAVLLGHVDNGLGLSGVFKNLKKLSTGDDIFVTNEDGSKVHFTVTDVTTYDLKTAPVADILNSPIHPVAIHIITCEKTFYGGKFHYDQRVVVTAVPV